MARFDRWKRHIVAASLANLSLLRVWSETLTYSRANTYTMKLPPSPAQYAAAGALLGLLTVAFWLLIAWAERSRLGKRFLLIAMLVPLNAIRELLSRHVGYLRADLIRTTGSTNVAVLAAVVAAVLGIVVIAWWPRAYRAALTFGLIMSPLVPATVLQGVRAATHYDDAEFRDEPAAARIGHAPGRRVVWIIFDELDQSLAFERRPESVEMPEFARLRKEALFATAAYSPFLATLLAVPSLLAGRLVNSSRPVGPGDLSITYADSRRRTARRWSREPNVFSRARSLGFNSALVGWYHPYCRELGDELVSCWWAEMPRQSNSVGRSFLRAVPRYARSLVETSLFSPFGQSLTTQEAGRRIQALVREACRAAADPSVNLVFLHFQAPHGPHAYNRRTHKFDLVNSPLSGYWDSLALADVTLGRVRRAMEEAAVWNTTTVLVSSDHGYRSGSALDGRETDGRIPFLLKLAGKSRGVVYTPRFDSILSADLVLGLLRNELASTEQVVEWMNCRVHTPVPPPHSTHASVRQADSASFHP